MNGAHAQVANSRDGCFCPQKSKQNRLIPTFRVWHFCQGPPTSSAGAVSAPIGLQGRSVTFDLLYDLTRQRYAAGRLLNEE